MKVKVSYSPTVSEVNEVDLVLDTTKEEWVIGRAPDSDVILDSPDVSRLHGKFLLKGGSYYFFDLGSRNGSIVNGEQAEEDQPYILKDGDIIQIGDYVLIVEAVNLLSEQLPETISRTIDPSLFSSLQMTENVNRSNITNLITEEVSHNSAGELSQTTGELETSEMVNTAQPEISESSKVTFTQPDDIMSVFEAIITSDDIIQPPERGSEVAEEISIDVDEIEALEAINNELLVFEIALAEEANFGRSGDMFSQESDEESTVVEIISAEATDLGTSETVSQSQVLIRNDTIKAQPEVVEVFSNQYIDFSSPGTEEVSVNINDIDLSSFPTNVSEIFESTNIHVETAEETLFDEIAEVANVSDHSQTLTQRKIVLIAHESKKSELAEFVAQYEEFFSHSFTITWPSISEVLHQQKGITISQQISAATSGGYLTIASLVCSGDILAVIFLRDFLQTQAGQVNEEALLRLCNINQVLLATNVPTAEAIVHYIKHIAQ
ncbi:FHA domain-containing protein [Komarekiella sp. 'clone 1']|uniref:FHA domain-containing protein n=1 Tax=Komarekiella delphini-convector SJRDD-AB1 TaxID=2593771 RepID=A0AA40T020_9NOST|nr:FHA domain-containing protein [Komarekiella delphini-convector]MBD6618439.1 FHA domain-containing protein [Komarekiella delphini-convector SJRDD-AB1]